jgi:hypothetical protein
MNDYLIQITYFINFYHISDNLTLNFRQITQIENFHQFSSENEDQKYSRRIKNQQYHSYCFYIKLNKIQSYFTLFVPLSYVVFKLLKLIFCTFIYKCYQCFVGKNYLFL